jgi:hypothetical protein
VTTFAGIGTPFPLFEAPTTDARELVEDARCSLCGRRLHDETGVYVFRCASCRRFRAHWDIA